MIGMEAVVVGATGLVGRILTGMLLEDQRYSRVRVLTRRPTNLQGASLDEHLVDFNLPETWKDLVKGEVLFSCLGTTRAQAGSKAAQYLVDYSFQADIARAARENGVSRMILVSSYGADPGSAWFYPRIKGELEETVRQLDFPQTVILRPSILDGTREKARTGERFGIRLTRVFTTLIPFLARFRPIPATVVGKAMLQAASEQSSEQFRILSLEDIFSLAEPTP